MSSLKRHLLYSAIIRLVLIAYGEIQDKISEVQYTDIDYRVVTDGAMHIYNGRSPFDRHTYRYTPLLAIFLLPNIYLHRCFGKLLFAAFDLVIAVIIKMSLTAAQIEFSKLETSSIILIKPTNSSVSGIEEDYGLGKHFSQEVSVKVLEGDHASILKNPEFLNIINN
jgi:phosphatidylinositol glycan class M